MELVVLMIGIAIVCFIALMFYASFEKSNEEVEESDKEQIEYLQKWEKKKKEKKNESVDCNGKANGRS